MKIQIVQKDAYIETLKTENASLRDQLKKISLNETESEIKRIGKWLDIRPATNTQLLLDKNLTTKKYYLTSIFSDGSSCKEEVRVSKENGLIRFQEIHTNHVEWFIIEKNGDLSMYSQNGKYGTAPCF